jgi:hypothetical protein
MEKVKDLLSLQAIKGVFDFESKSRRCFFHGESFAGLH